MSDARDNIPVVTVMYSASWILFQSIYLILEKYFLFNLYKKLDIIYASF
jgi:hypothetical protein